MLVIYCVTEKQSLNYILRLAIYFGVLSFCKKNTVEIKDLPVINLDSFVHRDY